MDLDRIEGAGHEVKGAIKEAAGKVTGDKSTEIKGKVEKNVGTVQREVGETKDDIQDQKEAWDSADKNVDIAQSESDPRSELGLKSPVKREDDIPRPLGKESRNDQ